MTDKAPGRYLVDDYALAIAAARDHLDLTLKQEPYVLVFLACLKNKAVLLVGNYLKVSGSP